MYSFVEHSMSLAGPRWEAIERFVTEPPSFLPAPAHPLAGGRWRVTLRAGRLTHEVAMSVGQVWTLPNAWIRAITWQPARHSQREPKFPLLPDFTGRIALRQSEGGLRLEVAGHYAPPLGRAGEVLDAWKLHQVAEGTVEALAGDIIEFIHDDPAETRVGPADESQERP